MSSKDSKYTSTILPKKLFPKQTNGFVLIDTKEMILDLTILIIDDDCENREMLQEAIIERMPDAKCLNASNGLEGLHLLLETKEDPQLIFLDLNMTKMNVLSLWQIKTKRKATIKFLLSSTLHQSKCGIRREVLNWEQRTSL
jgi:response regulator RpfG family c-di-GMP phosphodiesterase